MKVYVLTQAERDALLAELEITAIKVPYAEMPGWDKLPLNELHEAVTQFVHRRFHYVVCKALG